jgi:hypothetical protein
MTSQPFTVVINPTTNYCKTPTSVDKQYQYFHKLQ